MVKIIKGFPISPRIDLILKYAGFPIKVQRECPERVTRVKKKIIKLWEEVEHLIYPEAIYEFFNCQTIDDYGVFLMDESRTARTGLFHSSYLASNLKQFNSSQVALFVVTIGGKIIEKIDEHLPGLPTKETWYLEAIASEAVEVAARRVCQILAEERGYKKTFKRLSPGWGEQKGFDWKLSEQKILFELLGRERIKNEIGVELIEYPETESYMMKPRKSVSAIAFPIQMSRRYNGTRGN